MSKPSISVAYSMKKKAKKDCYGGKMASGGTVNYADGGKVSPQRQKTVNQRRELESKREGENTGIHEPSYSVGSDRGMSQAGAHARSTSEVGGRGHTSIAKGIHSEKLSELKSMKGPHGNYAEGGEVNPMQEVVCPHCTKSFSHGGEVANDLGEGAAADEMPNEFDDLVLRDGLEFSETGSNSGDEDGGPSKNDLVARAMLRKKAKR